MYMRDHCWFRPCYRLLQVGLGGIGLMVLLTACFGQPCPVGVPAPPQVTLVESAGNIYVAAGAGAGNFGTATILQASNGAHQGDTGSGRFEGANNGSIYVAQPTALEALRASDHTVLWQYQASIFAPVVVAADVIYLSARGAGADSVVALRASDGTLLWSYQTTGYIQRLAADTGLVSFITADSIGALQASNGAVLWQKDVSNPSVQSLYVDSSMVYFATYATLQALRASDGSMLWQKSVSSDVLRLLAASNGIVYLGTDEEFQVLQGSDGSERWQKKLGAPAAALVDGGIAYVSIGSSLFAFQSSDGSQVWQHQLRTLDGGYYKAIAVDGGAVYVGIGGIFHYGSGCGFNESTYGVETVRASDGKLLWSYQR